MPKTDKRRTITVSSTDASIKQIPPLVYVELGAGLNWHYLGSESVVYDLTEKQFKVFMGVLFNVSFNTTIQIDE